MDESFGNLYIGGFDEDPAQLFGGYTGLGNRLLGVRQVAEGGLFLSPEWEHEIEMVWKSYYLRRGVQEYYFDSRITKPKFTTG